MPPTRPLRSGRLPARRASAVIASLVAVLGIAALAHGASRDDRPNVILILADDLGSECLGCYGGTSYRTPCLDRLAARGARFARCYATPLCSPSRAELLTGRYCFRTGITGTTHMGRTRADKLDVQKHRTIAQLLREAGYATCIAGKWHLCNDFADNPAHVADAGFEDRLLWRLLRGKQVVRHFWNPELWVDGKPNLEMGKGKFGDDLFTDHVIQFMRRHREKPFFAYYPMTLVHSQTATGRNYPASPDTLPAGVDPDQGVEPKQKGFAGLVAYMDKLVGRIVDEVERLGLAHKTLVLFVGDNGTDRVITSRIGDRKIPGGKTRLDEAGTRVPLIAWWQGVTPAGAEIDDLVDLTDFMATILQAAGVALPEGHAIDGRSFLPQLRGQKGEPRSWVYRHLRDRWFIRDAHWRLDSSGKLWDVSDDPYSPKPAGEGEAAAAARRRLRATVTRLHKDPRFPEAAK